MNAYYQQPTQLSLGGLPLGGQQVVYPNVHPLFADVNTGLQPLQMHPQQVYFQHQPSVLAPCAGACYPGLSSCWMHRPPGEMMHLPPPPPGRPGQWVQWHSGEVLWLAPPAIV